MQNKCTACGNETHFFRNNPNDLFCQKCQIVLQYNSFPPPVLDLHKETKKSLEEIIILIHNLINVAHSRSKKDDKIGKNYRDNLRDLRKILQKVQYRFETGT